MFPILIVHIIHPKDFEIMILQQAFKMSRKKKPPVVDVSPIPTITVEFFKYNHVLQRIFLLQNFVLFTHVPKYVTYFYKIFLISKALRK